MRIHNVVLTAALFTSFWVCLSACFLVEQAMAEDLSCGECYSTGSVTVLEKPSLGAGRKVCDAADKLLDRAREEKCKFLSIAEFYGVPQGVKALVELDRKEHYVVHLLRTLGAADTGITKYLGEFIDRTLTDVGGSKKDLSLLLDAEPAANIKDPLQLTYFYIIEDYQWSTERVTGLTRKYQRVRLTGEGKTEPLGETVETKGLRNLASITIEQGSSAGVMSAGDNAATDSVATSSAATNPAATNAATNEIAAQQVEVSLYYEDPLFTVSQFSGPRFFRSFPLLTDKQRTVLQFFADQQGSFRPAILRVHRGDVEYGQIRVRPTGEDEISLSVRLR